MLGRSPRRHVWILLGLWILVLLVLLVLFAVAPLVGFSEGIFGTFAIFESFAVIWPVGIFLTFIIVGIRRLHDMDLSGWWMLVSFVSYSTHFLLLMLLFGRGTEGANRFGDEPRGLPLRTELYQYAIANREHEEEFNLFDPIGSFIRTVSGVVTRPVGFFAGMAKQGDFLNPLIFSAICAIINYILVSFVATLVVRGAGFLAGLISGVIFIFSSIISVAVVLFILAGIFHLLVLLLVRPNAGFEATFRVLAYTSVALLASWLAQIPISPILTILIGLVVGTYGIVLGIIGIRGAHSTTTGRAAAVVLIPALVVVLVHLGLNNITV